VFDIHPLRPPSPSARTPQGKKVLILSRSSSKGRRCFQQKRKRAFSLQPSRIIAEGKNSGQTRPPRYCRCRLREVCGQAIAGSRQASGGLHGRQARRDHLFGRARGGMPQPERPSNVFGMLRQVFCQLFPSRTLTKRARVRVR